ncbi:hypothetical protein IV87_GL000811 [Pediococcus ethanolidurans]|uniref:Uncharacterized protein n=1 Tax=Pediococcus ethanolidurans TaxID=319653 RepID=A0A0R2K6B2_9LACO|nr:hypothetical protein IV87_GL000811 [Pediococcus ethanolidurans]
MAKPRSKQPDNEPIDGKVVFEIVVGAKKIDEQGSIDSLCDHASNVTKDFHINTSIIDQFLLKEA